MIGIMGGTFNPIHYGHLRPALEISQQLQLQRVHFIPANIPPHREAPSVSPKHRLNMVQLAVSDIDLFVADDREIVRNEVSYTIDTVRSIRAEIDEKTPLCLLIGMDAYLNFTHWHQWEKILSYTHLVVSARPNYERVVCELDKYHTHDLSDLQKSPAGRITFIPVTQLDISATMLRNTLKMGNSPQYLMPTPVIHYLHQHKLY